MGDMGGQALLPSSTHAVPVTRFDSLLSCQCAEDVSSTVVAPSCSDHKQASRAATDDDSYNGDVAANLEELATKLQTKKKTLRRAKTTDAFVVVVGDTWELPDAPSNANGLPQTEKKQLSASCARKPMDSKLPDGSQAKIVQRAVSVELPRRGSPKRTAGKCGAALSRGVTRKTRRNTPRWHAAKSVIEQQDAANANFVKRASGITKAGAEPMSPTRSATAPSQIVSQQDDSKRAVQPAPKPAKTTAAVLNRSATTKESNDMESRHAITATPPRARLRPPHLGSMRPTSIQRSVSPKSSRASSPTHVSASAAAAVDSGTKVANPKRSGVALWQVVSNEVNSNSAMWHAAQMLEWKASKNIPMENRVFSVNGQACQAIKKLMKARPGWVCNEDGNMCWDIKFAFCRNFKRFSSLTKHQTVGHFENTHALTTKIGLCNSLAKFSCPQDLWLYSFFPRCYDLMSYVQTDKFIEDFKVTECLCLLRRFVHGMLVEDTAANNGSCDIWRCHHKRAAISAALEVCKRRLHRLSGTSSDSSELVISPEEWAFVQAVLVSTEKGSPRSKSASRSAPTSPRALSAPPSRRLEAATWDPYGTDPSAGLVTDVADSAESMTTAANKVLQAFVRLSPQFAMDGFENIWIVKPTSQSKGVGIQLSKDLDKLVRFSCRGCAGMQQYVVQKYIENPLVISKKKWDIRQWVLVTSWDPLTVWFYNDCYVRFSFHDYDPLRLKNKYSHLTNNCISKEAKGYAACKDTTMWHSDELRKHLSSIKHSVQSWGDKILTDPWTEHVQPEMKICVLRSLEATRPSITWRQNCFELFGYDFMVSDDLNVWLIEVNSGPDLSSSTTTTNDLVHVMLEDLVKVVIDVEDFGSASSKEQSPPRCQMRKRDASLLATGRWELLDKAVDLPSSLRIRK